MCGAVICQPQISFCLSSHEMHTLSWILRFTYSSSVASSSSFCCSCRTAPTIRSTSIKRKAFLPAEPNTCCLPVSSPDPHKSWLPHNLSYISNEHIIIGSEKNSSCLIYVAGRQPMWISHQFHLWSLSYLQQRLPTIFIHDIILYLHFIDNYVRAFWCLFSIFWMHWFQRTPKNLSWLMYLSDSLLP